MPDKTNRSGALIINKSMTHCLMVFQKKSQMWGIPKGRVEKGENFYKCMIREIKEEAGINFNNFPAKIIRKISITPTIKIFFLKMNNDDMIDLFPPEEDGKENHEIEKIEWVPFNDIYMRKINSVAKKSINKFQNIYCKTENNNFNKINENDLLNIIENYYS